MSKWTKNKKKDKRLDERKAYARINKRDRSKASMEVMKEKGRLQYTFARECWLLSQKKNNLSPKGLTWDSVFEKKWGTPLKVYIAAEQQRQRENVSTRNIQSDPDLP